MQQETPVTKFAVTPGIGRKFTSEQLTAIARVTGANGSVELTTLQQLIVTTSNPEVASGLAELKSSGAAVYPIGAVVKNIRTCSFCSGSHVEPMAAAESLDRAVAGLEAPFTLRVGFSGCDAICAESLVQDIGVVPRDGGFDLYIGGKASGEPRAASLVASGVQTSDLNGAVLALIETYRSQANSKERLWKLIDRVGLDPFRSAVAGAVPKAGAAG